MSEPIKHLLIPKEFKLLCTGRISPKASVTTSVGKCTCVNCLNKMMSAKGKRRSVKTGSIPGRERKHDESALACAVCGSSRVRLESDAEGYYCPDCSSSDSDE